MSFTLDFKSLLTLKKIFLAEETSDKDATVKCTNGIKEQVLLASMHSSIPDHRWNAKKKKEKKKKKRKEKGEKEREETFSKLCLIHCCNDFPNVECNTYC